MLILIAEDLEDTRVLMKLLLEMKGHEVLEAANGEEAIRIATLRRPDLVVMDLNMPILDGLAAIKAIRKHPAISDRPILALTGRSDARWRQEALEAGCNECLTKPLDFGTLDGVITRLARGP